MRRKKWFILGFLLYNELLKIVYDIRLLKIFFYFIDCVRIIVFEVYYFFYFKYFFKYIYYFYKVMEEVIKFVVFDYNNSVLR